VNPLEPSRSRVARREIRDIRPLDKRSCSRESDAVDRMYKVAVRSRDRILINPPTCSKGQLSKRPDPGRSGTIENPLELRKSSTRRLRFTDPFLLLSSAKANEIDPARSIATARAFRSSLNIYPARSSIVIRATGRLHPRERQHSSTERSRCGRSSARISGHPVCGPGAREAPIVMPA